MNYLCLKLTHTVILIDSKYAIQARGKLELPKTTSQVSEVIQTFKQQDVLQWIQGHSVITGNEKADAQTNKAILTTHTTDKEIVSKPQSKGFSK